MAATVCHGGNGGTLYEKGPDTRNVPDRYQFNLFVFTILLFYVRLFALTFLVLVNLAKQCVYAEVYAFLKGVAHLFCMKVGAGK